MEAVELETKELLEEFHDAEENMVQRYGSEFKARKSWLQHCTVIGKSIEITNMQFLVILGSYFKTTKDRKSTRLNSSHPSRSRMPSSA